MDADAYQPITYFIYEKLLCFINVEDYDLNLSSLVVETIPRHRDYHALCQKERSFAKKVIIV